MNFKPTLAVLAVLCGLASLSAHAQAVPTASGPGAGVSIGGAVTAFRADYGQRTLGGYVVYADAHLRSRYSLEGEARFLRFHTDEDVIETNYLIGPRVEFLRGSRIRPYAKFLVGAGLIRFPFDYATGSYLTLVPGAGVDIRLTDRITFRPIDFEYQTWSKFTYGPMHPVGLTTGISIRLTRHNLFTRDPYVY